MLSDEKKKQISDFLRGKRDCQEGMPHKPGEAREYDRGYDIEYFRQESMTAHSIQRGGRI